MKKTKIKTLFTWLLTTVLLSAATPVFAEKLPILPPPGESTTGMFMYDNEDPEEVKNAKITTEEAIAAKEERMIPEADLGYKHDRIVLCYDRKKTAAEAQKLNLSEWDLYQQDIRDHGDDDYYSFIHYLYEDTMTFFVNINDNKTVKTAVEEYRKLDRIIEATPEYYEPSTPAPTPLLIRSINSVFNDDSITFSTVHENTCEKTMYRWEYCKIGTSEWHLLSDWNTSDQCTWYPDANEYYAVVCKASYNGDKTIDAQAVWYASRPQMEKKVTARCTQPNNYKLMIGCTSTVTKDDDGYFTSCYLWSFDHQTWIAKSSYEASNCAWFDASELPKGTYMMYNCTEKMMPDGSLRKLSCDYYLFTL